MSEKGFIKRKTMQGIADAVKEKTGLSKIAVTDIEDSIRSISGDDGSTDLANEAMQTETARLQARLGGNTAESEDVYNKTYQSGVDDTAESVTTIVDEQIAKLQTRTNGDSSASETMYNKVFNDGVEAGVKSEYDRFWDSYQDYGDREDFSYAFAGKGWSDSIFIPKYTIAPVGRTDYMFRNSNISNFDNANLDFTQATNLYYSFSVMASLVSVPVLDLVSCGDISGCFQNGKKIETIEKIIFYGNEITVNSAVFSTCSNLKHVIFEGELNCNNLTMKDCSLLDKESLTSIVNTLSANTTGKTITLSLTAVNNAFGGNTSQEWLDLVATKPNWTISLA